MPNTTVEFDLITSPGRTFFRWYDCVLIRRGVIVWMIGKEISDSSDDDSDIDDLKQISQNDHQKMKLTKSRKRYQSDRFLSQQF